MVSYTDFETGKVMVAAAIKVEQPNLHTLADSKNQPASHHHYVTLPMKTAESLAVETAVVKKDLRNTAFTQ